MTDRNPAFRRKKHRRNVRRAILRRLRDAALTFVIAVVVNFALDFILQTGWDLLADNAGSIGNALAGVVPNPVTNAVSEFSAFTGKIAQTPVGKSMMLTGAFLLKVLLFAVILVLTEIVTDMLSAKCKWIKPLSEVLGETWTLLKDFIYLLSKNSRNTRDELRDSEIYPEESDDIAPAGER